MSTLKSFYVNLYTSKDEQLEDITLENIIDKDVVNVLNDDSANKLEGKITYQEALLALKHMKNDKSPGPDGFTVEFYKFFWRDIGTFLIRSVNLGFDSDSLSHTQKQGIISILPKGDKPREFLKKLATYFSFE